MNIVVDFVFGFDLQDFFCEFMCWNIYTYFSRGTKRKWISPYTTIYPRTYMVTKQFIDACKKKSKLNSNWTVLLLKERRCHWITRGFLKIDDNCSRVPWQLCLMRSSYYLFYMTYVSLSFCLGTWIPFSFFCTVLWMHCAHAHYMVIFLFPVPHEFSFLITITSRINFARRASLSRLRVAKHQHI